MITKSSVPGLGKPVWYGRWIHTHTHTFNGPLSRTTRVGRYQKGKTNLDFTEARDSEWQWHQLGHMQVCTSLQTDNHASAPPLSFFTGRMPFLLPNRQRRSTEGTGYNTVNIVQQGRDAAACWPMTLDTLHCCCLLIR